MEIYIGVVVFVAIALIGWGFAEWKNKHVTYTVSQDEKEAAEHEAHLHPQTGKEMNIHDVINTISSKGYSAV